MKRLLVLAALLALVSVGVFAQTTASHSLTISIPAVHCIELNDDTTTVALEVQAPLLPGNSVTGETDTSKRLWYTVIRGTAAAVTVNLDPVAGTDDIPAGLTLTISTAAPEAGTAGAAVVYGPTDAKFGTEQAFFTINTSVATGRLATDGAPITYVLGISNENLLTPTAAAENFTVTYTISAS